MSKRAKIGKRKRVVAASAAAAAAKLAGSAKG